MTRTVSPTDHPQLACAKMACFFISAFFMVSAAIQLKLGGTRAVDDTSDQRAPPRTKVVAYSLYGSNPRYTDGALANADLMPQIYPGWEMWVYHDASVPPGILEILRSKPHVRLIGMDDSGINTQTMWRFLVASDRSVARYVIRDIDSRLSTRERAAVKEWENSPHLFHVMRDHPSHESFAMSAGMWGGTYRAFPLMESRIRRRQPDNSYTADQKFLTDVVWPIAKTSVTQHDSFSCTKFGGARPFPTRRIGAEHIGSVYIEGKLRQNDVDILNAAGVNERCEPSERGETEGFVLFTNQMRNTLTKRHCFPRASGTIPPRKGQITSATTFSKALTSLAAKPDVHHIIEIGTWYGGGSTQSFVDGLRSKPDAASNCITNTTHHCCTDFITTFEVYKPAWDFARLYHQNNPVNLVLGTTVGVNDMLKNSEIPAAEKGEHYKLYYERDRKIMASSPPQLEKYCNALLPEVVLIDGNEYTGWGEFEVSMKACRPKYLALHDTGTLKTHKVEEFITNHPEQFTLISKGADGAGWSVYEITPSEMDFATKLKLTLPIMLPEVNVQNTAASKLPFKLIILTQRRHASLQRLLSSISQAHYDNHAVHLEIRIDYHNSDDHQKTIDVANAFIFPRKHIHIYKTTQGLQRAWFNAWTPISDTERAVIIEDDMELSPLWFRWLRRAWDNYGDRYDLGGISLCRQRLRASDGASIMKQNDAPFLYRMVGSFGFSPNAKYWGPFVKWTKGISNLATQDVSVKGTATTQWHQSNPDSWEQFWIWWCWHDQALYTLYVHTPNGALIAHWAEPGVHSKSRGKPNDRLLTNTENVLEAFPPTLTRFGWDFEAEPTQEQTTTTIWSNDFHISPIRSIKLLLHANKFIDKSLSGHCHLTSTCANNLKVLTRKNGISPSRDTVEAFQNAYKNDKEFASVDVVMCFHPSAMCELFMPFKKKIFVVATTRYEMGRHVKHQWETWNKNLREIAATPGNVVAANNLYDAKYIEHFTGIQPVKVLPSFSRVKHHYEPASSTILAAEMHSPNAQGVMQKLKQVSSRIVPLREKYARYKYSELCTNTAIIHMPYQVSVMSLFEQYSMGIPIIVPSLPFLWELHNTYDIVTERTWDRVRTGRRPQGSPIAATNTVAPDPNNDISKDAFLHWVAFADYYQWPHIVTFDSFEDLGNVIQSTDWAKLSKGMQEYAKGAMENTKGYFDKVM